MVTQLMETGRRRVLVLNVAPEIEAGEFPIKRIVGQRVTGECRRVDRRARSGHLPAKVPQGGAAALERNRHGSRSATIAGRPSFGCREVGHYRYTIEAWVDHFKSWQHDLKKRLEAGQEVAVELASGGRACCGAAAGWASGPDIERLQAVAARPGQGQLRRNASHWV